jgi:hypothetical protein
MIKVNISIKFKGRVSKKQKVEKQREEALPLQWYLQLHPCFL